MAQTVVIYIGGIDSPSFTFNNDVIRSVSEDNSVDVIGRELCTDTIEFTVEYTEVGSELRDAEWATPIYVYIDSQLDGKFYLTDVSRVGVTTYRVRGTSAAGIMEYETFYGGIYNGETFQNVAERIISTNGMMPYKGIYTKCERDWFVHTGDNQTDFKNLAGQMLGSYFNQGATYSGAGAFLSATMSSKMKAKFTLHGFLTNTHAGDTAWTSILLGCISITFDATALAHQYGMYMKNTRPNTSTPWPQFGEVFFQYGNQSISLGTPTESTTYEVDVDPVAGTAKINGTTYSIVLDQTIANDLCALHVYGGGCHLSPSITYGILSEPHTGGDCATGDYYYYTITAQDNTVQCDAASVKDIDNGGAIGFIDLAHFILVQNVQQCQVSDADIENYDGRYGDFPLLERHTEFVEDVMSRVQFSPDVAPLLVYGWIPVCTKREALHQLLFSQNAVVIKSADGSLLFTSLYDAIAGTISADNIFQGGSEEKVENTNILELTAHSYEEDPGATPSIVFENAVAPSAGYYVAELSSAPVSEAASASGISVLYAGCNACVVSGAGTISAKPYKHSRSKVTRTIAQYPNGRTVSVADATLVTHQNANKVLDKMEAYYKSTTTVKVDIVSNNEKCGHKFNLTGAFGEAVSGFLCKMSKQVSSFVKAACEFVSGFTPPPTGAGYSNYVLLSGSGTWNVPAEVLAADNPKIYVVLIGAGDGGESGYAGENGTVFSGGGSNTPAAGGAGGNPIDGGSVFEFEIQNPASSYTYQCGVGGTGAAICTSTSTNNKGTAGGATTISGTGVSHSSAEGTPLPFGYTNLINGEIYAKPFESFPWNETPHFDPLRGFAKVSTGHGGDGGVTYLSGTSINTNGAQGSFAVIPQASLFYGGTWGKDNTGNRIGFGAGGGGGYGENGQDGGANGKSGSTYYAGNGGNGGNATLVPPKATDYNAKYYGYGGHPGGGGGGGGCSGWIGGYAGNPGTAGTGGYGGAGGDGGDGCVLIYY